MLIPFTQLVRHGASDPPRKVQTGINPENIKLVQDEEDCFGWDGPAAIIELDDGRAMTVAETAKSVILATRGMDRLTMAMVDYESATSGTPQ